MLYIVGGASRAGKTMIAEELSKVKGIPYLSLDWIMMGFTNGIPEYGVHDKLFPDEIAARLWSFFKAMFGNMLAFDTDIIIEGEAILPNLIHKLVKEHPDKIRVCFLGYVEVDINEKLKEIRKYSNPKNDWLEDKSDEYVIGHIRNMMSHSILVKEECIKNKMKYFDTTKNFKKTLEKAFNYLS